MPSQQLQQVGQAREGLAGAQLQEGMDRFQFGQNERDNALSRFMSIMGGGSQGGSSTQQQPIYGQSPWATGLGAASSLAGIGGSLFGQGGIWPQ